MDVWKLYKIMRSRTAAKQKGEPLVAEGVAARVCADVGRVGHQPAKKTDRPSMETIDTRALVSLDELESFERQQLLYGSRVVATDRLCDSCVTTVF